MSLADRYREASERPCGQRHRLPQILERLTPDDRADVLALLSDPTANYAKLARLMHTEYGADVSYSTWARWAKEIQTGRKRWV